MRRTTKKMARERYGRERVFAEKARTTPPPEITHKFNATGNRWSDKWMDTKPQKSDEFIRQNINHN